MKSTGVAFAAAILLSTGAAWAQSTPPRDTGNMAYPAPVPQGNIATTTTGGQRVPDTGNMAYPQSTPGAGVGGAAPPRAPDTGNMAYPAPNPQGTVTTPTK